MTKIFLLAITAIVLVSSIAVSIYVLAQEQPLGQMQAKGTQIKVQPDSWLYQPKLVGESVVSLFTFGNRAKAERNLYLFQKRLKETECLLNKGKEADALKILKKGQEFLQKAVAQYKELKKAGKSATKLDETIRELFSSFPETTALIEQKLGKDKGAKFTQIISETEQTLQSISSESSVATAITSIIEPDMLQFKFLRFSKPFIDVHAHCFSDNCHTKMVEYVFSWVNGEIANILSGEVYGLLEKIEPNLVLPPDIDKPTRFNENAEALTAKSDKFSYFAGLECWYNTKFDDPAWLDKCKEDVDRLLGSNNAKGFKELFGKTTNSILFGDTGLWAGEFNAFNGYCSLDRLNPNKYANCLKQSTISTIKYPLLEEKWRALAKYITEVKQAPILIHATESFLDTGKCYNPLTSSIELCHTMLESHLFDFGKWAKKNLTPEARKRIIFAHLAFLDDDLPKFKQLLDAGFSVDTARRGNGGFEGAPASFYCNMRRLIGQYPNQFIFGTDRIFTNNRGDSFNALTILNQYQNIFEGNPDKEIEMKDFRGNIYHVRGMDLDSAYNAFCNSTIPADTLSRVLKDNFLNIVYKGPQF